MYLRAVDVSGVNSGWQQVGAWTVASAAGTPRFRAPATLDQVEAARDRIKSLRDATAPPPEESKEGPTPSAEISHTNAPRA
jgi:hypothetical protein